MYNIALNKPTKQSSVYNTDNYDIYGACNGQKTGKFGFHTLKEDQPWWQIDLQEIYKLNNIKIYNRVNACAERASTLNILLSEDAVNWELCYANNRNFVFGGIDGNPLLVNLYQSKARYIRLQLREQEFFHLDEVEIFGTLLTADDSSGNSDQDHTSPTAEANSLYPPKEIPADKLSDFTLGNKIPVIHYYLNETVSSPKYFSMEKYNTVLEQLNQSTFKYYGKTLDYLLKALDKYSLSNQSVLIFGLANVNCDAISIWKGANIVYVIDYNLPISEHPQVKMISYDDYISQNIQADVGISISSFEHDGLGRYGDPINPNGDLEAMQLAKNLIKQDGILFFSVPIGKDCLVWNAHRIYGKIRLPMILEGWEMLDKFGFSQSLFDQKLGIHQQPVFVLRNL